jgi:hypothetical protein
MGKIYISVKQTNVAVMCVVLQLRAQDILGSNLSTCREYPDEILLVLSDSSEKIRIGASN